MAAQATLTINDGQTVPVAKNFLARGITPLGVAKYVDTSSGTPIGFPVVTLSMTDNPRSPTIKVETRVVVPVLEVISGADGGYTPQPKVAYENLAKSEYVFSRRTSLQGRKDLRAFNANLQAHAVLQSIVHDLEMPW